MIPVLPVHLISSLERRLVAAATEVRSPFTGTSEVQDWGGEWWEYRFDMAVTKGADARRLSAFFAQLAGVRGRFLFADPSIEAPGSVGSPAVSTETASGNSLPTSGWTGSLDAGAFFQLGSDASTRLYQLTTDVTPVAGAATLQFVPALRATAAATTALVLDAPKVLLRLTSPVPARIGAADNHLFTVTAREAI